MMTILKRCISDEQIIERIKSLSIPEKCPGLLLLSATPVLGNEAGFLGLLHLLDPTTLVRCQLQLPHTSRKVFRHTRQIQWINLSAQT